jgi:magnesium transporter
MNKMSDEFEQRLVYKTIRGEFLSAFGLSKSLVYYQHAIASNGTLLQKLQNAPTLGFNKAEKEFLDDIVIENTQCQKQAEIYSSILSNMMAAHENIVGNDLNTMLKVLNVITIGIMVPTFVVSAGSMNVNYPVNMESWWAFWAIMVLVVVSTWGFILLTKKLKW